MGGPRVIALVALAAFFTAACGERQSDAPTAPDVAKTGTTAAAVSCNLNNVTNLARDEFGGGSDEAGLANDMKQAGARTDAGTLDGYHILAAIAGKYEAAAPTTTTPSQLAAALLACMKLGTSPAIPSATSLAKNLASTGAFEVRGLANPDDEAVASHDGAWRLTPSGTSWQAILGDGLGASNDDSLRYAFLALGNPVDSAGFAADTAQSGAYEWATLPATTFTGNGVIIGECTTDPNYLQHFSATNSNVEVLGYVDPQCPATDGSVEAPPRNLAERLFRFLEPQPLSATLLLTTGSGGSKRTLSPFIVVRPGHVILDPLFSWRKSGNTVNLPFNPTPAYQITSQGGTNFKQEKVLVWITATGNKGTNVDVCNNYAYTDADGIATFTNVFVNKSGGYTFTTRSAGAVNITSPVSVELPKVPPSTPLNSPLVNIKSGVGTVACEPGSTFRNPTFDENGILTNPPPFPGPNHTD